VDDAIDDLYGGDLEQFTARRNQLAADAKAAGDAAAAKEIGALRKPTQAAFTVNQLARTDPDTIEGLVDLGNELQRAQRSADAAGLRELNRQRRTLLNELVERAFDIIGQQRPSAGQREEVTATLQAALADPELAAQIQGGALVKAAESSGFGFTPPELTLVRRPPSPPRDRADTTTKKPTADKKTADESGEEPKQPKTSRKKPTGPTAKERAEAAAAERRAAARAIAQQEVDAADAAVDEAVAAIDKDQQLIRALQRTLSETKQQLEDHKTAAKAAEVRQRRAREALNKLR
jgi:hypothetical protein